MPEKTLNDLSRDLRTLYSKGDDAFKRENTDYAIELFTQILEKEPAVIDVRKQLRAAQQKKSGAGKSMFKRVFSSASSATPIAKGRMALRKNPLEALAIAENVLNTDANNAGAHDLLADAALAADLPQTAVMSLELMFKNAPTDKAVGMKLAEALVGAGQSSRAERVYEELRRAYPADNEIHMALKNLSATKTMDEGGYTALASGQGSYRDILKNKDEAVRLEQEKRQVKAEDATELLMQDWEGRLAADPNNMKMLRNLAETHAQRNEFDKALSYYDRMSAIDGGNDAALVKQISDLKVKRLDAAIAQLDTTAPDYPEKAAQLKTARQVFQLDECKARAEKYPTDLQIRFELGRLYYEAGKIREAIGEFQKAQNSPHRKVQAMTYLAKCFEQNGLYDPAVRKLQEALKEKLTLDDEKKDLLYTLGSIFEKMGKKDEATQQFMTIYENDMNYRDVEAKVLGGSQGGT